MSTEDSNPADAPIVIDLMKLSVSAAGCYESCARKYKYMYLDKLPKIKTPAQDIGNFVHEVLQYFHDALNANPDLMVQDKWPAIFTELCDRIWPKYKDGLDAEHRAKCHFCLKAYLDYIRKNGIPQVLATEDKFSLMISPNVMIRGVVDRVDLLSNGVYRILDYKTGASRYLDDFQLRVYGLYLKDKVPELTSYEGMYLVLGEGPKEKSYKLTMKDAEDSRLELLDIAQQIRDEKVWAPKPTRLCGWCDFEKVCPSAWSKSHNLVNIGVRAPFSK